MTKNNNLDFPDLIKLSKRDVRWYKAGQLKILTEVLEEIKKETSSGDLLGATYQELGFYKRVKSLIQKKMRSIEPKIQSMKLEELNK